MSQQAVGNLAVVLSANASGMASEFKVAEGHVSAFAGRINGQAAGMGRIGEAFGGKFAGGLGNALGSLGGKMAAVGLAVGVLHKVGEGAVEAIKRGAEVKAGRETIRLGFKYSIGDGKLADAMMGRLQKTADANGLSFDELAGTTRKLMAGGLSSKVAADQALKLTKIAAGTGGDLEGMTRAAGQIGNSGGRLLTDEFNQLKEHMFPVAELAKTAGMEMDEFKKAMAQGKIGADVLTKTIDRLAGAGGKFENVLVEKMGTADGVRAKRAAAWDRMGVALDDAVGWSGKLNRWNRSMTGVYDAVTGVASGNLGPNAGGGIAHAPPGVLRVNPNPFRNKAKADQVRAGLAAAGGVIDPENDSKPVQYWAGQLTALGRLVKAKGRDIWEGFTTYPREQLESLQKEIAGLSFGPKSGAPLDAYQHRMGQLAAAERGFGTLPRAGVDRFRLDEFARLEQATGFGGGPKLAPLLTRNSQAAEAVISQAMAAATGRGDREAQVKGVLEAANRQRQKIVDLEKQTLDALKKLDAGKVVNF